MGVRPEWTCARPHEPAAFPGSAVVGLEGRALHQRFRFGGQKGGWGECPRRKPPRQEVWEPLIHPSLPQVIMPGYCVQGTVGHKILSGQRKLEMEGRQVVSPHLSTSPVDPTWVGGGSEPPPVLMTHIMRCYSWRSRCRWSTCPSVPTRMPRASCAVGGPGGARECAAGARRGQEDGVSEAED